MSEELDHQVLTLLARLATDEEARDDINLIQGVWRDRQTLVDAMFRARDWDMLSAEARSLARVDHIINEALEEVGE